MDSVRLGILLGADRMYIYDDTGKDKTKIRVGRLLYEVRNYRFVMLENGDVGLINMETMEFISDQYAFYFVADEDGDK